MCAVAARVAGPSGEAGPAAAAALERAIVEAVAYADVFDYPLTADEVHRYLAGLPVSLGEVHSALTNGRLVPHQLSHGSPYYTLPGRESAIATRRTRAAISAGYWRSAVDYGRRIASLPFVRMVAVTGALAMDNVADADIDYLVVTEPGRLWLCRALVVAVVRWAALRGVTLCPNYFLSENALVLTDRNLFTAHEVAQMVPLAGLSTYARFRRVNYWTEAYLPNASGPPRRVRPVEPSGRRVRALTEHALRSRLGGRLEGWEMRRKMRKLGQRGAAHLEAYFGADWCKGHFGDHGQRTLSRYQERLEALDKVEGLNGWATPNGRHASSRREESTRREESSTPAERSRLAEPRERGEPIEAGEGSERLWASAAPELGRRDDPSERGELAHREALNGRNAHEASREQVAAGGPQASSEQELSGGREAAREQEVSGGQHKPRGQERSDGHITVDGRRAAAADGRRDESGALEAAPGLEEHRRQGGRRR